MQKRFDKANRDLTANTLFVNRAMATMMPVMTAGDERRLAC